MTPERPATIEVRGASAHNLKDVDVTINRGSITVITGVSGSGKSSLAFDTILAEAQRRFFYTLSHYSRQFLDLSARPPVRTLSGLSPAISLAQNETQASRRATVGTMTDLSELLAVLFARFGDQRCPVHDRPTAALTPADVARHLLATAPGQTLALCAPVATAKKGAFKAQLTAYGARGYLKAVVDGVLTALSPTPVLAREERHTIQLVIDYVVVKPSAEARLIRSIETVLAEGEGFGEYYPSAAQGELSLTGGGRFSSMGGCPDCRFAWPRLDARHISANSLGQCPACLGLGERVAGGLALSGDGDDGDLGDAASLRDRTGLGEACGACGGTGLDPQLRAIRLLGRSPHDVHLLPLNGLKTFLAELLASPAAANAALRRVAEEASACAGRVVEVGLGYLTLARRIRSLSGGEAQRLRLAGILSETLRGVLYVLDEPSQGLHPRELAVLMTALRRLQANGNTVLIVDHDETLMRQADWIIDLGPGGGARGGRVMATFRPSEAAAFAAQSLTARYLSGGVSVAVPAPRAAAADGPALELEGASVNNLRVARARFPLAALTVVTGVSGAGKSSLVLQTLYPNASAAVTRGSGPPQPRHCKALAGFEALVSVALVDRRPIAKSSVSLPASYLEVLGELRDLYASQPEAQVMGLTARSFSLSVDAGRCPECKGRGELSLKMRFLADARVRCPVCKGSRFQAAVLAVRYLGLSISAVLELTLDEAMHHFRNHRRIVRRLAPAVELGLGYLKLGQPTVSLSGGEAQRLKLVPHLSRTGGAGSLIILDEPTTGLHFEDVACLLTVLKRLAAAGATIVAIEHNADFISAADWVIELGPGSARDGGLVVRQGAMIRPQL